ncbi:MAG: alpha-L-rhamnosidase [Rikenellaceae bacterium]|nr:alpha-L-rhamnosidase [Rikenellaceae bacterium]
MYYKGSLVTLAVSVIVTVTAAGGPAVDELKTEYVTPVRVMWVSDGEGVRNPEKLLEEFNGQVSVVSSEFCVLSTRGGGTASVLLDFGREYQGGIEIAAGMRGSNAPANVRVRFGESVSEAMSDVATSTATNDHAMRDFTVQVPWLGTVRTGESGFRFVRLDLLDGDTDLNLVAVRAVARYCDIPYLGSFASDDERLDRIWQTGAYTVHLNMQEFLWDGVKRDRLVWLGDMHPEVMCISTVFGENEVVRKSLDLARDETPLPGWMNGMCSYSLWWIILHSDLYLYRGDLGYLREQHEYLRGLVRQVVGNIDGGREMLGGGERFLDWPTSEIPEVIHAGLQALTLMALERAAAMAGWLGDTELESLCRKNCAALENYRPDHLENKQAASLLALAGLSDPAEAARVVARDGAANFSTFYGYYMLEALAGAGMYDQALSVISDYWGAMLDLGATTFWEDLDYSQVAGAGRIDEFVPGDRFDIHADGGAYCYLGLRHSLCHGWASGPTPWLSRHVLGILPLEPGFAKVATQPNLGRLGHAKGTFPTPHGIISVSHQRLPDGTVRSEISLPVGVELVATPL